MNQYSREHHQLQEQQRQQILGVNKLGKNIRKSPLHLYNLNHQQHQPPPPPPRPRVYNINKSDFRSVVQRLTGSPSHSPAALPHPRPPSTRLHRIRPPPLSRPPPPLNPNSHLHPDPASFPRPSPSAPSPLSAYMRYLENSLLGSDTSRQLQPPPLLSRGLLPTPRGILNPSSLPPPQSAPPAMPSPSGFLNLVPPRSPYPLLSPGFQYPPPLTHNFALSPLGRPGMSEAAPGPGLQPPPSPGLFFPQSPSGFFPLISPRWMDMYSTQEFPHGIDNSSVSRLR